MRTITRIDIGAVRAGATTRIDRLASSGLLRARVLPSVDGVARVALVQTAASLLSGDVVEISATCGPGARLEVVEVAGLVAHDVRGGAPAELRVAVRAAAGARVCWEAQPLVLAAGCDLRRSTRFELAAGAVLLGRDALVLGRHGEACGRLRSELTVLLDGRELHVEALDTGDLALLHSVVVVGEDLVLDTVALYGARGPDGADVLQLAGEGSVLPVTAPGLAAARRRTDPTARAWRAAVLDEVACAGPPGPAERPELLAPAPTLAA